MWKMLRNEKVIIGKKNRQLGAAFERKVRADLEEKGWIVIKNPNNVIDKKFKQGKSKYNPFTKQLMMNSGGFPDFLAFKYFGEHKGGVGCPHCPVVNGKYTHILPYEIINGRFPDGYWENHNGKELYGHQMKIFEIFGVECKSNGHLTKEEKEKCKWLLVNNIFSEIYIVSKGIKRGEIVYKKWEE